MSKNDVRALINKRASKIRSIRDRTSDRIPLKDWMLDFLTDVDGKRQSCKNYASFKGAILSRVCILESKIKSVDARAKIELEFNDREESLDAIVIRWGRKYRELNGLPEEPQRFQVMDILLRELGLE